MAKKTEKSFGPKRAKFNFRSWEIVVGWGHQPFEGNFFLEANNNPMVLGQENKGDTEAFHSHTLLMTSDLGAVLHQQHT